MRPPHDCLPLNSSASQHREHAPGKGKRGGGGPRGEGRVHDGQIWPRATFAETRGSPAFLGRALK